MLEYLVEEWAEREEGVDTYWEAEMAQSEQQFKDGRSSEAEFHSSMCIWYSLRKDPENCRKHAALITSDAMERIQTNKLMSLARMLLVEKNVEGAIEMFRQCLVIDPDHDMALWELGACHYYLKDYEAAKEVFLKMLEVEEDEEYHSSHTFSGIGFCLAHQEKHAEALPYFKKAIEKGPNDQDLYLNEYAAGLCYNNMGDAYMAMAHYCRSLDARPTFVEALNNLGALYFNEEADVKMALSYYEKAIPIAIEQNHSQMLGMLYLNMTRLYGLILDYTNKDYYHRKFIESVGLGELMFGEDDEEDEEE